MKVGRSKVSDPCNVHIENACREGSTVDHANMLTSCGIGNRVNDVMVHVHVH